MNSHPPGTLCTFTLPRWASTMPRVMASPSPARDTGSDSGVRAGSPRKPTSNSRGTSESGNAAALIAHPDDGGGPGAVVAKDATKSNVDGAAGVSVPDRVGNQVRERPIQLTDVAGNGEGSVAVTAQLNALFGGQWLEGRQAVGDDVVEGNPFGCDGERLRTGSGRARIGRPPSSPVDRRRRACACRTTADRRPPRPPAPPSWPASRREECAGRG